MSDWLPLILIFAMLGYVGWAAWYSQAFRLQLAWLLGITLVRSLIRRWNERK
jgi:hypothetical protein